MKRSTHKDLCDVANWLADGMVGLMFVSPFVVMVAIVVNDCYQMRTETHYPALSTTANTTWDALSPAAQQEGGFRPWRMPSEQQEGGLRKRYDF